MSDRIVSLLLIASIMLAFFAHPASYARAAQATAATAQAATDPDGYTVLNP